MVHKHEYVEISDSVYGADGDFDIDVTKFECFGEIELEDSECKACVGRELCADEKGIKI